MYMESLPAIKNVSEASDRKDGKSVIFDAFKDLSNTIELLNKKTFTVYGFPQRGAMFPLLHLRRVSREEPPGERITDWAFPHNSGIIMEMKLSSCQ